VISAASATLVWSFQSQAMAAGLVVKRLCKASGWPSRSTGSGVLRRVESTAIPIESAGGHVLGTLVFLWAGDASADPASAASETAKAAATPGSTRTNG
jgi:hypothetical protein